MEFVCSIFEKFFSRITPGLLSNFQSHNNNNLLASRNDFQPVTFDKLIWTPGYKIVLDLPYFIQIKRKVPNLRMRMALNVKSERKEFIGLERYVTMVVLIPCTNAMHRSEFRIYVSSKKDGELVLSSNFDVPIPCTDYFFVVCEGDDLTSMSDIKGDLTITCLF